MAVVRVGEVLLQSGRLMVRHLALLREACVVCVCVCVVCVGGGRED